MIKCVKRYRGGGRFYEPGEIIALDADTEAWLMRDAPGCFVPIKRKGRALDAPPLDRMMRREEALRRESERGKEEIMTSGNMPGLVRGANDVGSKH